MNKDKIPFVFWGTPDFATVILDQLKLNHLVPELIITAPNRPSGRGQKSTPPPVKVWADKQSVPTLQPESINANLIQKLSETAPPDGWSVFVVVAYGHILPMDIVNLPNKGTLNVHPSLLPKLRGPAPIREAILREDETGVSIIQLDEKMDHGPIVVQQPIKYTDWPPSYDELKNTLAVESGRLLAKIMPEWIDGKITAAEQDHSNATYSRKFSSDDGLIDFDDKPAENLRKIRAFTEWPKAHYFDNDQRIIITQAHLEEGELVIDRIKPAGMDEIPYTEFKS